MPIELSRRTLEPTFGFLAKLVPSSSLLQEISLKKAVRMWVIIYTFREGECGFSLPVKFRQWYRWAIEDEGIAHVFGQHYLTLSLADLLFGVGATSKSRWLHAYQRRSPLEADEMWQQLQSCPYQVSQERTVSAASFERFLRNDFYALVELGVLVQDSTNRRFSLDEGALEGLIAASEVGAALAWSPEQIMTLELADILSSFRFPIRGVQRLFMDLDYVVSETGGDQVSDVQRFLYEQVWMRETVPLIRFEYASKSLNRVVEILTYPVALYYSKRALYLCGFGQSLSGEGNDVVFYNFRLDQIYGPRVVSWPLSTPEGGVLSGLFEHYEAGTLPRPEMIREMIEVDAWGFDVGLPARPLLLRFDRGFHDSYIDESDRHETFRSLHDDDGIISQVKLQGFFKRHRISRADQAVLRESMAKYSDDAFYGAVFREGDNNIVMRLRAWGPKVEVLYPFSLRERMRVDLQDAIAMYEGALCRS